MRAHIRKQLLSATMNFSKKVNVQYILLYSSIFLLTT